jgi:Tfp pilus assembly protein PilX
MRNLYLVLLIALISCKSVKKDVHIQTYQEAISVERTLDNTIKMNKQFDILTRSIYEPIFIDSSGIKVKAFKITKYSSDKSRIDSVVVSNEKVKSNSKIVIKDNKKSVKKQDYSGLIILLVLLIVATLFFKRLFRIV